MPPFNLLHGRNPNSQQKGLSLFESQCNNTVSPVPWDNSCSVTFLTQRIGLLLGLCLGHIVSVRTSLSSSDFHVIFRF